VFAYLDCGAGLSGDMFLGALVGAGLHADVLRERLRALGLDGYSIEVTAVRRAGLPGTKVDVVLDGGQLPRDWREIRALIEASGLDAPVKERALATFGRLAAAEAAVHGVEADAVHFHEVGALDSIVDIVGAAIGLHELGIDELWCSPVRLGRGTVATSHGELPVPAPATALLLLGVPVFAGEIAGELTTPTGAALLAEFADRFAPMPPMRVSAEGWGAGSRDHAAPNLARLLLGEPELGGGGLVEVAVLESVIDNVTPELLAATLDIALQEGALDAWGEPVTMKKGRLGTAVTVLAKVEDAARLTDLLMLHTGTLGVRRTLTWRQVSPRRVETVETSLGRVRVKVQGLGPSLRVRPENDDVVAIARAHGLPLDRVARTLTQEAEAALLGDAAPDGAPDAGADAD
jgi:pyridinium-3,5-bisthiocarboxylic acid mononucleotide nickel chelatase